MDFNLDEAIPVLERTPALLTTLLDDLPEDWTRVDEGADTWSPREVVAHLIHGERTDWIPRARIILKQESYRRFDPFDRFAELKTERPLKDLLEEFDHLRSGNVATLRGWNLKEKDMELTGEHPEFGTVTMRQLLAYCSDHANHGPRVYQGRGSLDSVLPRSAARRTAVSRYHCSVLSDCFRSSPVSRVRASSPAASSLTRIEPR